MPVTVIARELNTSRQRNAPVLATRGRAMFCTIGGARVRLCAVIVKTKIVDGSEMSDVTLQHFERAAADIGAHGDNDTLPFDVLQCNF